MKKATNFTEQVEKFLDLNLHDMEVPLVINQIKKYLEQEENSKALLLAVASLDADDWSDEIAEIISGITNVNLNYEEAMKTRWNKSNEFISDFLKNQDYLSLYKNVIMLLVIRPLGVQTVTALFLYQANNLEKNKLIDELFNFYTKVHNVDELFFKSFRIISDLNKGNIQESSLRLIANKLAEIKSEIILISLYWYHSYLKDNDITSIIFEVIPELKLSKKSFSLSTFEKFSWPDFPLEFIKKNYEKLHIPGKNYQKRRELFARGIQSLIPICLYAKSQHDVATESLILWNIFQKSNSVVFLDRLSELTGQLIPLELVTKTPEERERIINDGITFCDKKELDPNITFKDISEIKKLYTIQPFNHNILSTLLNAYTRKFDGEALDLFKFSVSKIMHCSSILYIIKTCILLKSDEGMNLVMNRLNFLNTKFTLNQSISLFEIIRGRAKFMTRMDANLILQIINIYKNHAEQNPETRMELKEIISKCYRLRSSIPRVNEESDKTNDFAITLYKNNEITRLLNMYDNKKPLSIDSLELILKMTLDEGLGNYVLQVYSAIVKKDPRRAMPYSIEVEPFVRMANRNLKSKIILGTSNLNSRIWQIPAILENPINRSARSLT
ncbi:MAG: hypothetical protein WCW54_01210 [Candidatus Paceibacterota bacterium]